MHAVVHRITIDGIEIQLGGHEVDAFALTI
jgi:hypothetical protein